jgi:plastocyanin
MMARQPDLSEKTCVRRAIAYHGRKTVSASVIAGLTLACGSASGPAGPTPDTGTPGVPTVTISSSGVSPREISVRTGDRVTFINNDSIPHDVAGGPDPATPDCREIDAVGFLTPGQSRQTSPLPTARTCEYHDHGFHSALFNGRIVIR